MAYDYLGLVNDVCVRLGETKITSGAFASAISVHDTIKEAVNSSIRHINQSDFMWPDNFSLQNQVLTAGTMRYPYPATAKWVDFNTFRLRRNASFNNETIKLRQLDYEEYLEGSVDDEYNTADTGIRSLPSFIIRAPSREFLIWPSPDEAYTIDFETYLLTVDLSAFDDAPVLSEQFRKTIIDGAMYYMYLWNSNHEAADKISKRFEEGYKALKGLNINRYEYMRDTRVRETNGFSRVLRISDS